MPAEEVEFYWPQIWSACPTFSAKNHADPSSHLLLTYPSPSNALESFIISRAEESTHSAMLVRSRHLVKCAHRTVDLVAHASCSERSHSYSKDQSSSFPHLPTCPTSMP